MFFLLLVILLVDTAFGRPHTILFDNFVGYNRHYSDNKTKTKTDRQERIHFPQEYEETVDVPRINVEPKCANGLPFCDNVDFYPYKYLKGVLEKNKALKVLFGQDEGPNEEILQRAGAKDGQFVCRSIVKTVFPKIGQNKNNNWKFIINQGEQDGFVQGIQIEICKSTNGECEFPGNSPIGSEYQTSCIQKFMYRRLLSLNDEGVPVSDTFKIPSACCCAYKQNFEFLTNLRIGYTPAKKNLGGK